MGKLVCELRDFRCWNGSESFIFNRPYGCYFGNFNFDKTYSFGASLDGVLGILDSAVAANSRRTDLGFRRALGKLGRTISTTLTNRLAEKLARMVYQIKKTLSNRFFKILSGSKLWHLYRRNLNFLAGSRINAGPSFS